MEILDYNKLPNGFFTNENIKVEYKMPNKEWVRVIYPPQQRWKVLKFILEDNLEYRWYKND